MRANGLLNISQRTLSWRIQCVRICFISSTKTGIRTTKKSGKYWKMSSDRFLTVK